MRRFESSKNKFLRPIRGLSRCRSMREFPTISCGPKKLSSFHPPTSPFQAFMCKESCYRRFLITWRTRELKFLNHLSRKAIWCQEEIYNSHFSVRQSGKPFTRVTTSPLAKSRIDYCQPGFSAPLCSYPQTVGEAHYLSRRSTYNSIVTARRTTHPDPSRALLPTQSQRSPKEGGLSPRRHGKPRSREATIRPG
jgi:hypothetical protein